MSRYLFILLFIMSVVNVGRSQSAEGDSLRLRLQEVHGAEKIAVLINLVKNLERDHPFEAVRYGRQALKLLRENPDPAAEMETGYHMGWTHYYLHAPDSAWKYARRSGRLAETAGDLRGLMQSGLLKGRILRDRGDYAAALAALDSAIALGEIGDPAFRARLYNEAGSVHRRRGENSRALDAHTRALELLRTTGDKSATATTLGYLGIVHDILGNYDVALRHHQQSLKLREELDDPRGAAASLTNMGILHQKIESYDEAMRFYQRALSVWKELGLRNQLAATMNNMGAVQELLGNYEQALPYYSDAYHIWSELGDPYDIAIALDNMGNIRLHQGAYDDALNIFLRALHQRTGLGDKAGSANTLLGISNLYQEIGMPDSALSAAQRSLALAAETGSWPYIRNAHEVLTELYEESDDYERALEHYKQYKAAHDTLFNSESRATLAELQEQYRTAEQQKQIELLQQNRQLQNLWLGILIGGFVLAVVVLGLLFNRYHLKKRAHEALEQLHRTEIEKANLRTRAAETASRLLQAENDRKSEELEAARRLQLSMLPADIPEPDHATIAAYMETAAEVGGDYYDFNLGDDGTLTICIGDATGHGTKAGTLVTATKSLFNLMAGEEDLRMIMQRSTLAIKKMNLPKLYMALALVRLHGNRLELVGAGMPPALIYRAGRRKVETIPLKGMPLGSIVDYPYRTFTVTLDENDALLLLSDGYPELTDDEGVILGYDRLPELLAETGDRSPKEIINHFKKAGRDWIRDGTNDDDITFVALKMKAKQAAVANRDAHKNPAKA